MSIIRFYFVFSLITFLLIGCQPTGQTPIEIARHYHESGKFNGSLLVAQHDRIIIDTFFGYQDLNSKAPLKKETAFYIASLSKPITAIAVSLLVENGLLSLDDKATKFVEDLPAYAHHITIKQLLNHTSGIRDYENVLNMNGLTNHKVISWLQLQDGLAFVPGTKFQYSNSGYIILSLIIEKVSKMSYAEFLKKNIFDPLQMYQTKVDELGTVIPDKAIGYNKDGQVDDYVMLTTGDGGIYSTVEDLYQLDKALRKNQLLSEKSTKLLYQTPILPDGTNSNYGMGWFMDKTDGGIIAQHTGGLAGFRSLFWRNLKNGNTIIALTNKGDAFPVSDFRNDLQKVLR